MTVARCLFVVFPTRISCVFIFFLVFDVVFVSPLRIHWKPTFFHALFLVEKFANRPQKRRSDHADDGRPEHVFYEKSTANADQSCNQKRPPAARSEIIFRLDDERVKQSDNQKRADGDDHAGEVDFHD